DEEGYKGANGVENQNESSIPSYTISKSLIDAFIPPGKTPKPDGDNDRTIAKENVQFQAQGNHTRNESSFEDYTVAKSLIDAFIPPGKTPKAADGSESVDVDGREYQNRQSQSSIGSYTTAKSLLNAFTLPGKTPTINEDNEDESIAADAVRNQTQSSFGSYAVSKSLINAFIPPGKTPKPDDDDSDITVTADQSAKLQANKTYAGDESSIPSYTVSKSLLDAFIPPGKTPTINEDDENAETIVADGGEYQNRKSQSSIGSWTISQSALDAFIPPGKTPKPDDDNDQTITEENVQVQAQENQTQNESSIVDYTVPKSLIDAFIPPGKTPKANDAVDDDVEMMEVDGEEYQKNFVSNQHKPLSESITTSSQPPLDFRAPQIQHPNTARVMTSRLSLLLPRFMQPTTSSSARTSKKPVSCASPVCSKQTNPPLIAQEARAPATTSRSLQKPHVTPRKSVAVCRKVLDQSFNAAKLPVLDPSQFEEFQPTEKSRPHRSSGGKRIHPLTPQQPTSKFGVSNKENLNRTKAFDLLQQYQSPVTPRVAAKRITPNSKLPGPLQFNELQPVETSRLPHHTSGCSNDPESQIDQDFGKLTFTEEKESSGSHSDESVKIITPSTPRSSSNVLEYVLQTPTSSKNTTSSRRTIPESPIDHDFENAETSISLHRRGDSNIPDSPIDHDFDFANPFTSFDSSIFSVNTPGPSRSAFPKRNPLIPVNFRNESNMTINDSIRSNESVIKITAAQKKNDKKVKYVLAKPKLVKPHSPEIDQPNLRRSQRTRVRRLRIYTLVDTETVEVKNPRAVKYLTVDPGEQIEREKALKKRQKSRKEFAKVQRERENDL
uniref:Uncharacterized protein n=1 Tax=Panagrolaimus sp. PS1159 TaxID=55785 RepID=A0AC35FWK3_9BILA